MSNDFYNHSGYPSTRAQGDSSSMRAQLAAIAAGFDKMPALSGNALRLVRVNAGATALESVNTIDGIVIGGTTPAAGTFTTLSTTGNVTLGNAGGDTLTVNPSAVTWPNNPTHSGTHTLTGRMLVADGTAAIPSLALANSSTAGFYRSAANTIGFATNGVESATLSPTTFVKYGSSAGLTTANSNYDDLVVSSNVNSGLTIISGTAAVGGIIFQDSTDGVLAGRLQYAHSTDTLTIYAGASIGLTMTSTTLDTANALTSSSTARFNGAVYGFLGVREGGAYGGAGPNSNNDGLVIESDGSTGISILTPDANVGAIRFGDTANNLAGGLTYSHATDALTLVTAGTTRFSLTAAALTLSAGVEPIMADLGPTDVRSIGYRGSPVTIRNATASFDLTDSGETIRKSNTTAYTWTIEPDATVDFPIGTVIILQHDSTAGDITVARGAGVALVNGTTDANQTITAGNSASIQKMAANRWRYRG